jgi:hypothetical protein
MCGCLQAQFGDEATKVQLRRAREASAAAAAVHDANLIPLGQREQKVEKKETELEPIPDVEWWDARILLDPKVTASTCLSRDS